MEIPLKRKNPAHLRRKKHTELTETSYSGHKWPIHKSKNDYRTNENPNTRGANGHPRNRKALYCLKNPWYTNEAFPANYAVPSKTLKSA